VMKRIRVALAQIGTDIGDFEVNAKKVLSCVKNARLKGADLIVFPELCLNGYPPEDLLLKPEFLESGMKALREIAQNVGDIVVVLGFAEKEVDIFNSAAVIFDGKVTGTYRKHFLPNYGVFDERRYFGRGIRACVIDYGGLRIGVGICEDIWHTGGTTERAIAAGGAEIMLNLSASPFERGKHERRRRLLEARSVDSKAVFVYVNTVRAQDELVFDGGSCVYHPEKGLIASAPRFKEDVLFCDVEIGFDSQKLLEPTHRYAEYSPALPVQLLRIEKILDGEKPELEVRGAPVQYGAVEELYEALTLGLSEYVRKNGFEKVVVGLSGGIDSALTAALAVEALGPEKVTGVFLPSKYTSALSRALASSLAENLGIELIEIPIEDALESYRKSLEGVVEEGISGTTDENIQARIRGNMLMALSNRYGWLVLATGNKSEFSMGYCTLYGDMAGGFALLKDVFKTQVYEIARYLNYKHGKDVIPEGIIEREPTAELRPGQLDTDSLPPYFILDPVLEAYIEGCMPVDEIVRMGYDRSVVEGIVTRVDLNEYKRRQAPVGLKVTKRAFGRDWRMPISYLVPGTILEFLISGEELR